MSFLRFLGYNQTTGIQNAGKYLMKNRRISTLKHRVTKVLAVLMAVLVTMSFADMSAMAASTSTYQNQLIRAGFPSSYAAKLAQLQARHPNWTFEPLQTGLNWDRAVGQESLNHRNTVYINPNSASATRLYRDMSTGTYQAKNGFDYSYAVRDGSTSQSIGWIDASKMAVAYFMNPLTFLGSDSAIFQFESLNWNFSNTTHGNRDAYNATTAVLKNTFMDPNRNSYNTNSVDDNGNIKYIDTNGQTQTLDASYPMAICGAAKNYGLDPCYLAAKIIREVGANGKSGSVSGKYSGYTGYYNFLNIGANDSSNGAAVSKALAYAKNKNWTNPVASIYGGADIIYNDYVAKGQNTPYLQKFNVSGTNNYNHQYMTAINGVVSPTNLTYAGYKQAGILDNRHRFIIPVFENMPGTGGTSVRLRGYSGQTVTGTVRKATSLKSEASYVGNNVATVAAGDTVYVSGGYRDTRVAYDSNYRVNAVYYRMFAPLWYKVTTSSGTTGYIQEDYLDISNRASITGSQTFTLNYSVTGSEQPSFMSQDTRIATVDASGRVTGRGTGTTKIVVYLTNGSFDVLTLTVGNGTFTPAPTQTEPSSGNTNTNRNNNNNTNNGNRPSNNNNTQNGNNQRPSAASGLLNAIRSLFGRR